MVDKENFAEDINVPRKVELEKENERLKKKLKIAENSLNYIAILDNNYIIAKLDAQQALQKIKEVENEQKRTI